MSRHYEAMCIRAWAAAEVGDCGGGGWQQGLQMAEGQVAGAQVGCQAQGDSHSGRGGKWQGKNTGEQVSGAQVWGISGRGERWKGQTAWPPPQLGTNLRQPSKN